MKKTASILLGMFLFMLGNSLVYAVPVLEGGDKVYLDEDTEDDAYLAGGSIILDHTIQGDLIVAGGDITINGDVTGDVIAAGGVISIKGSVGDDVRIAGGNLSISGKIGDDVFASGGTISVDKGSEIGGSAYLSGGVIHVQGNIKENLHAGGGDLIFGGQVTGNMEVADTKMQILPSAKVLGNMVYTGQTDPKLEKSFIQGKYEFQKGEDSDQESAQWMAQVFFIWIIFSFTTTFVIGAIFLLITPYTFHSVAQTVTTSALRCLGVGFLAFLATIAGLILGFLSVIGLKVGLFAFWILLAFFAVISAFNAYFLAYWLSSGRELTRGKAIGFFALGLLLYEIISFIPVFGVLFSSVLSLMNLGGLYYTRKEIYTRLRKAKLA